MAGLSLYDLSDAEFLARVKDTVDVDGYASTTELVKAFGFKETEKQSVVVRCAWMKRYGLLRRETDRTLDAYGKWALTAEGELAVNATFNKKQQDAFESLKEDQLWIASQALFERRDRTVPAFANLIRREAQSGFARRR